MGDFFMAKWVQKEKDTQKSGVWETENIPIITTIGWRMTKRNEKAEANAQQKYIFIENHYAGNAFDFHFFAIRFSFSQARNGTFETTGNLPLFHF